MNIQKRTEEIERSITAFTRDSYHKSELLPEMLKLQSEVVNLTFNEQHADNASLRLYDVTKHFAQINKNCGNICDKELAAFEKSSKGICNLIKAEISGQKGEAYAFKSLKDLTCKNLVLKNIELENEGNRSELDAIVITEKGIFLVEVKNTHKNVLIDKSGKYYRNGNRLRFDCYLKEKMNIKETLLSDVLGNAGFNNVPIFSIVAFTCGSIEVQNYCKDLTATFASNLIYHIEFCDVQKRFNEGDMAAIYDAIKKAKCFEYYPVSEEIKEFKRNYTELIVKLESINSAREIIEEKESKVNTALTNFREFFKMIENNKQLKTAASNIAITIASAMILHKTS